MTSKYITIPKNRFLEMVASENAVERIKECCVEYTAGELNSAEFVGHVLGVIAVYEIHMKHTEIDYKED